MPGCGVWDKEDVAVIIIIFSHSMLFLLLLCCLSQLIGRVLAATSLDMLTVQRIAKLIIADVILHHVL